MEKRLSRIVLFIAGFFSGLIVSALIVVGVAYYAIQYPQKVIVRAVDFGIDKAVEKTVEKTIQSIPKDYIGKRQGEITSSAERFARAFSQDRISQEEANGIARQFLTSMADQQITPQEIDDLLRLVNRCAR
jgi:hypothetical protein